MNKKVQHLLSVFLIAFFVFIAMGSGDENEENENSTTTTENTEVLETEEKSTESKEEDSNEGVKISAVDLYKALKENSSNEEYKGNYFNVEGIIADINKDLSDEVYLTLNTEDRFGKVQCFIKDADAVANLKKGQKITVYGKGLGIMGNVLMEDCKIVKGSSN